MILSRAKRTAAILIVGLAALIGLTACGAQVVGQTNEAQYVADLRAQSAKIPGDPASAASDAELIADGKQSCKQLQSMTLKQAQDAAASKLTAETGIPLSPQQRTFSDTLIESARVNLCGTTDDTYEATKTVNFIGDYWFIILVGAIFLIGAVLTGIAKLFGIIADKRQEKQLAKSREETDEVWRRLEANVEKHERLKREREQGKENPGESE